MFRYILLLSFDLATTIYSEYNCAIPVTTLKICGGEGLSIFIVMYHLI